MRVQSEALGVPASSTRTPRWTGPLSCSGLTVSMASMSDRIAGRRGRHQAQPVPAVRRQVTRSSCTPSGDMVRPSVRRRLLLSMGGPTSPMRSRPCSRRRSRRPLRKVGASGCLMACVAIAEAGRSEDVRSAVAHGLGVLTDVLAARFDQEITNGRLSASPSAETRSRMLVDLMQGLMLRARAGASAFGSAA